MDRVTGHPFASRSEVLARRAMAATSQPLATQAAVEILRQGGHAIDAAIAANAVLAVVEPTSCGPGGDLFAMVWDAEAKSLHGLNASGCAPAGLDRETFAARGLSRVPLHGPLAVTVPGAVDGWSRLHERFGRLPWERLFETAIGYAREGFAVSELIAHHWQLGVPLAAQPGFASTFLPGGRAPRKGEVFHNPDLARTFAAIATQGCDGFYGGATAAAIEATVAGAGGALSTADLAAHRSAWVAPLSTDYRGYTVWALPPNGQGIAVLQQLNLLAGYDLAAMGFGTADHVHTLVEAKKLVFEDRARWYADPDFADVPTTALISPAYADARRALIDPRRAAHPPTAGDPVPRGGDTVYLCTADEAGNMVSLIQSIYLPMGSGVVPAGCGFVLQNRGALFALDAAHANAYVPGKRPFNTIIPGFVTRDGAPYLCFGVMGGAAQPQGQTQVLVNLIDFGMNVQEAGDAPRILHEGSSEPTGDRVTDGGTVCLETGFPYETVRALIARGHHVGMSVGFYGGYQAIRYDSLRRVYCGASESRQDGQAAGF